MAAVEEHKPAEKRRALGRGLDSLLPSGPRVVPSAPPSAGNTTAGAIPPPVVIPTLGSSAVAPEAQPARPGPVPTPAPATSAGTPQGDIVQQIALDQIDENPYQTRRMFNEDALKDLAESIKESGLAQPVVVRPGANGRYVLVLGERRCRASKLAGKTAVPAIVRQLGNEQAAEMTIVENLQRQDLSCLEQAQAFARLSREFNLTQEQIGKRTGTSRESVANYMRLLKLPQGVLGLVGEGKIGFSEARLLLEASPFLSVEDLEKLAQSAAEQSLTVKQLKERVDRLRNPETSPEPAPAKPIDPNVKAAEAELQRLLGMRVRVTDRQGKGTIVIQYSSVEDFDRLLDVLRA